MIEFSGEDEEKVIQYLITDMNPKSMADAIPGLPAHILFMCIRHADHVNDDRRMQSLLTNSINSIRKVVKVNGLVVLILSCCELKTRSQRRVHLETINCRPQDVYVGC